MSTKDISGTASERTAALTKLYGEQQRPRVRRLKPLSAKSHFKTATRRRSLTNTNQNVEDDDDVILPPLLNKQESTETSVTSESIPSIDSPPPEPTPIPRYIDQPKQVVESISIGDITIDLKMTPKWFEQEDQQEALKNIVYPTQMTDKRSFDAIARFRSLMNVTNNFRKKAINYRMKSTEMTILLLNQFVQQLQGDLSFLKKPISFDKSAHRTAYETACGIANLGNIHLVTTNYIPTARFQLQTNLNYEKDLAKSEDTVNNFVVSLTTSISQQLSCENNFIRVIQIEKDDDGLAKVDLGITTTEKEHTERFADNLEELAQTGFHHSQTLKCIKARKYSYSWSPALSYLQLETHDFNPKHNFDYDIDSYLPDGFRGGHRYHVPRGWYRHALDISKKYPGDDVWLRSTDEPSVWPVAYYGTQSEAAIYSIVNNGFSNEIDPGKEDYFRAESVRQGGEKFDRPGLYLYTNCKYGAHPRFTKTFSVGTSSKQIKRFRIVFQCRVQPDKFTIHECPVTRQYIWRVVDPTVVRPYGILLLKRTIPKREGNQSESDY